MKPTRTRVMWLPAHPSSGWASMLRHWRELDRVFRAMRPESIEIVCPLGSPPEGAVARGRFRRAWEKYVAYPLRLGLAGGADVVHVLDHSFAHLLRFVPRGARKIVTVHDLVPLEDRTLTPSQLGRFRRTVTWLNHADLLLAVSEATVRSLRKFLTAKPRIAVLPMGVNAAAFAMPRALPASIALPAVPRLLSIGSVLPRKNLALLPELLELAIRGAG
ncbi:MAG TPA: glycosyltransferase, partial [Chthoniobacteraceae bacterium]|nr:glycosyltransferase [Chthoniobacteraceae bacterium]